MGKKILLTGASGFTGRHFIKLANELGHECIALCHKETDFVEGCSEVIIADLTDKAKLIEKLKNVNPNYVVHLAAISFVAHGDVGDIYNTNVVGTINLLDCLIDLKLDIEKTLFASSGNVYGNNKQLPISENMEMLPVNDYAVSKCAMEMAIKLRFNKLPIVIVRPFNYTGVGQAEHFLIPKIVQTYKRKEKEIELGNLDVARDFSDVRDVVSAYIKLLESDASSEVFNICTGKATSLLKVIELLNGYAGYELKVSVNPEFVRENEIKELYGANDKLVNTIGNYREFSFSDTLQWMHKS
jgi:GDP-6-deoxy-D-talose 4-dehydrogenase